MVTRMAVADPAQYWPRTTTAFPIVFYSFHSSVTDSQRNLIRKAMIEYETKTCLRFQQSNRGNRVRFRSDLRMGCQSRVGRIPEIRPQHIFLSNSLCFRHGIILHEIGHTIGLFHAHTRPDRDDYVRILEENIRPAGLKSFKIQNNAKTWNIPYDYNSIMHYGPKKWSMNG